MEDEIGYSSIQLGAKAMLYETTALLNATGNQYIIVGGWSPYLLNSGIIPHPGTKDVDVLFDGAYRKGELKKIIRTFIDKGYILSAKHDFQLFKQIRVNGEQFIYNVDLLHPLETIRPKDIYVEHIDLGVPVDEQKKQTFKMKSIALPSSQVLFDKKLFTLYNLKINTPDGKVLEQDIPLMTEIGTLITKSNSVKDRKRYRDSLDIFLSIKQNRNIESLYDGLIDLKQNHPDIYNSLHGIRKIFKSGRLYSNAIRSGH